MQPQVTKIAALISTLEKSRIPVLTASVAAAVPISQKRTENDRSFYFSPFWNKLDTLLNDLNELVLIDPLDCQKQIQSCWESRVRDLDTPFAEWRSENAWDKDRWDFTADELHLCMQIQKYTIEYLGA